MSLERWSEVDRYITNLFVGQDPILEDTLQGSAAAGLPEIHVTPGQGKLLHLLARLSGARRILELGTLAGYSTIWLARALPAGGKLVTLEADPTHAALARANLTRAGLDKVAELRLGAALQTLPRLVQEQSPPFDFIFLDADKENYPAYLPWILRLAKPGAILISDNLVRDGAVIDPGSADPRVQGVRRFNAMLAAEPGCDTTLIQTVGAKGYDGFALTLIKTSPFGG